MKGDKAIIGLLVVLTGSVSADQVLTTTELDTVTGGSAFANASAEAYGNNAVSSTFTNTQVSAAGVPVFEPPAPDSQPAFVWPSYSFASWEPWGGLSQPSGSPAIPFFGIRPVISWSFAQ